MLKADVQIGGVYRVRLHGNFTDVRIDGESGYGGWNATNLTSGRSVRIKSAQKLRRPVDLTAARGSRHTDIIPSDGLSDGGEPYSPEEMDVIDAGSEVEDV